jgi:hypothetical protein
MQLISADNITLGAKGINTAGGNFTTAVVNIAIQSSGLVTSVPVRSTWRNLRQVCIEFV